MKILIISPIDEAAIRHLASEHTVVCTYAAAGQELETALADAEVLVFRSGVNLSGGLLDAAPRLQLLVRAGCGLDNIDLARVKARGLQLVTIPQPGAKAVAEMAFAMMLALARNLLRADQLLRDGHWAKYELEGYLLTGKTLGIVGAGQIGSRVGRLGAAWGMEVLGCIEGPATPALIRDYAQMGIQLATLDEVLERSDFLAIHVPLQESTRHLIDARRLAQVKPGAFLVNLSRGGVVDELALRDALAPHGPLRGAALDVHQQEGAGARSPLAALSNVILTPHIGASTVDSQFEIGQVVVRIVKEFADAHRAHDAACLVRS